jgi:hypothetical protein
MTHTWPFIAMCIIVVAGAVACGWRRTVKVFVSNKATAKAPTAHYERGPDGRFK